MLNVVCVKYGTQYNYEHVNRLYRMAKKNIKKPFKFTCLTDNPEDIDLNIHIQMLDTKLYLESYWWKMCIFDKNHMSNNLPEKTLYLDLDVIIQSNIDHIIDKIEHEHLLTFVTGDAEDGQKYPSLINSSLMGFYSGELNYFEKFMEDSDYNMMEYFGVCRYLSHKHIDDFKYLFPLKDWYSFIGRSANVSKEALKKYAFNFHGHKGYYIDTIPICNLNSTGQHQIQQEAFNFFKKYHE